MGSGIDRITLSRFWNIPEMISNQNPKIDENNKNRFFEPDQILRWNISDNDVLGKDHCYICQRQKYTLIFYERAAPKKKANRELYEIKDE